MKNIVLIGFMGTGKTAVAKRLARVMKLKYVSTDALIEKREGRSIGDIFSRDGEPYFRNIEKEIIKETAKNSDQVIDTGGGVVLNAENMENLKKNGVVICLWASPAAIYERTRSHEHRPLLKVDKPEEKIKELLEARRAYYEKADARVDTTGMEIDDVVEQVKNISRERAA